MLDIFIGANASQVTELSNKIADALKEKHNIVLKKSKVGHLISNINGFSNWHSFKSHLDQGKDLSNLLQDYEKEFEEEKVKRAIEEYDSPESLFKYLSDISLLEKSLSENKFDSSSFLRAISYLIYGCLAKNNYSITYEFLETFSDADKLIEISDNEYIDIKYRKKMLKFLNRIPGYCEEDMIMGQLSKTVYSDLNNILAGFEKLIELLSEFEKMPVVKEFNRFNDEEKTQLIGKNKFIIKCPELGISEDEYDKLFLTIIDSNGQDIIDNDALVIKLDKYGYKNKLIKIRHKFVSI